MKLRLLISVLCLALAPLTVLHAQFGSVEDMATDAKIEAVLEKIKEKGAAGPLTAEILAEELAALDQHAADFSEHKEHAARFMFTKAMIVADILGDLPKGREMLLAVKRDYPETESAGRVDEIISVLEKSARRDAARDDLRPLLEQVMAKIDGGSKSPEAFTAEIGRFDALIAKYSDNAEAAAHIAFYKAFLYVQVFNDAATGRELLRTLVATFPGTLAADGAVQILADLAGDAGGEPAPK